LKRQELTGSPVLHSENATVDVQMISDLMKALSFKKKLIHYKISISEQKNEPPFGGGNSLPLPQ